MVLINLGASAGPSLDISNPGNSALELKINIAQHLCVDADSFYLTYNGRILNNGDIEQTENVNAIPIIAVPRLVGGKGGFGSMLRAIGAQIEKTTNRDACRDLSGRRLRDINEEQRLKRWFAKQKERDELKAENKKKRLEKLRKFCEGPPLPIMEDREYNQQRADMAESVFEAVDKGFEIATSSKSLAASSSASTATSAKSESPTASSFSAGSSDETDETEKPSEDLKKVETSAVPVPPKAEVKKPEVVKQATKLKRTMWDDDLDSDVSSSDSEDEIPAKKSKASA